MYLEILLVGCFRVITMTNIKNIAINIFLYNKPRTTAKTQTLALTDSVKPQTLVLPYLVACFKFYNIALLLTKIPTHILIIINITKETNTLRILALCIYKMLTLSNLTNFFLHVMTYWEDSLLELPLINLSKKISLVFNRIRTCNKPFLTINNLSLSIMTCCNEIIIMPLLLIKSTKLNKTITHHIRIRSETSLHLVHSVFSNLIPILMMTVYHLQFTAITFSHSCSHLKIFLRRTIPFLLLFWTNLYIETIRMQPMRSKLIDNNT